jgi:hypothetical protein
MAELPKDSKELLVWADFLEAYARDWDSAFADFLTQEYWYLFTHAILAHWRDEDFNIASAMNKMKTGGAGAKRKRIQRAVDRKLLTLEDKGGADHRITVVRPTDLLVDKMVGHLRRTLAEAKDKLR